MSRRSPTRSLVLVALFCALTATGALLAVPFWGPVPFTLQVFFVLLAGMVLGPRLGATSMLLYVLLGLIAPVYAHGTGGLGVLAGPTGGYLLGFIAAAFFAGSLGSRLGSHVLALVIAGLVALVPVYALGVVWLAWQLHLWNVEALITTGVIPFLPLDVVKVIAAALVASVLATLPLGLALPERSG